MDPNPRMSSHQRFDPTTSALAFVDLLVPGGFEKAKALLAPTCEYHYGGNTLRGDAIIAAFEQSHAKAKTQCDTIVYLPGQADHVEGTTVTVRVFDRLGVKDAFHTYSDRLVVTVLPDEEGDGFSVVAIEHRPFAEERAKLQEFLQSSGVARG